MTHRCLNVLYFCSIPFGSPISSTSTSMFILAQFTGVPDGIISLLTAWSLAACPTPSPLLPWTVNIRNTPASNYSWVLKLGKFHCHAIWLRSCCDRAFHETRERIRWWDGEGKNHSYINLLDLGGIFPEVKALSWPIAICVPGVFLTKEDRLLKRASNNLTFKGDPSLDYNSCSNAEWE